MDSFFGIPSKHSGRVPSRKRKRKLPSSSNQQGDCIVCFDGNDFVLCDRRECPNPYHPSCVKRDNNLVHVKENLNCDTGGGEDIISDMPDSLLHHILAFLPIEDAATTSILSKRWRSLWFSQLILDFDDEPFLDASTFCNFVYSFMAMRDITLPIISFQLKCCSCFYKQKDIYNYKEDIYNFVYIAIQRRVENLYIDFSYSFTLPYFVLSSKTLSVLKLTRITVNDIPYVHLPSLKVLHLEHVIFTYYEYISKLLSGCPILQDLGTKDLQVMSPYLERPLKSLSNLLKANICNTHIEFDWLHNVERLRAMVPMDKFPYTFHRIAMFHNLIHMELIINSQNFPIMWKFNCLIKLLEYCPKLQSLIIAEYITHNKLCEEDWEEPQIVSKCLLSHLTTCSLKNYKGMNCELHFARYIMMNSRVLSAMTVQSSIVVDADTKLQMLRKLSLCPKNSPTCKLLFI